MNLRELQVAVQKALDSGTNPETIVVVDGFDHTYFAARSAEACDAHNEKNSDSYGQYGGEDCEPDYGPKVRVFLLG